LEGEHGNSDVKFLIGHNAGRSAIIAAFIATHIATMAGLWFGGARLPQFDFNTLNGYLVLGLNYGFANPAINFVVGGIIHYTSGIIWGVVFALIVHPAIGRFIKPLAALTPVNNYIKGVLWGIVLWIISSAFWMPLLSGRSSRRLASASGRSSRASGTTASRPSSPTCSGTRSTGSTWDSSSARRLREDRERGARLPGSG